MTKIVSKAGLCQWSWTLEHRGITRYRCIRSSSRQVFWFQGPSDKAQAADQISDNPFNLKLLGNDHKYVVVASRVKLVEIDSHLCWLPAVGPVYSISIFIMIKHTKRTRRLETNIISNQRPRDRNKVNDLAPYAVVASRMKWQPEVILFDVCATCIKIKPEDWKDTRIDSYSKHSRAKKLPRSDHEEGSTSRSLRWQAAVNFSGGSSRYRKTYLCRNVVPQVT